MRYIQRDKTGKVIGHFANEQPYATECVPDDHPDIVKFHADIMVVRGPSLSDRVADLEKRIVALESKKAP